VRAAGPAPLRLPAHAPGMCIGLFGGSFNPPHAGHRHAALLAMKRLRLDRVWWLVTPGNPLKANAGLPPLSERLAAAAAVARDPRIVVTGLEASLGTRFTHDTLRWLTRHCPGVHFVWIMGADNLADFHRWQRWRDIAALMPIAVVDRPQATLKAGSGRAARALASVRVDERCASLVARRGPPGLLYLHGPRSALSSTQLRAARAASEN
jgi:nicotinate-nucleotide adenylyltransferase